MEKLVDNVEKCEFSTAKPGFSEEAAAGFLWITTCLQQEYSRIYTNYVAVMIRAVFTQAERKSCYIGQKGVEDPDGVGSCKKIFVGFS